MMQSHESMDRRKALLRLLTSDLEALLTVYPLPELSGKRLFISGATGFIGYWLLLAIHCLNLKGAGIRVVALSRDPEKFLADRPECRGMEWLSWVDGDIRRYPFPDGRFDAFIHGAADTSPEAACRPADLFDSIVTGARQILEHALLAGTRRVLLLSSGAVYGEQPEHVERLRETDPFGCDPFNAGDAYAEGKRAMEMLGACFAQAHGIEPVVARCFAFIGYGLPRHLAISQFIRDAHESESIAVEGSGRQIRSYLFAADLAVWLLALLCRGRKGRAYNVGSPSGVSLAEAAESVRRVLAPQKQVLILDKSKGKARKRYLPDTSQATEELGLAAWTDLAAAIGKTGLAYQLASESDVSQAACS